MTQAPNDPTPPTPPSVPTAHEPGLDAAQQSLSDALRVSFGVLKVLMIVLFVVYLGSGIFRIKENEVGVRYRFGKEVGTHAPGWHVGWPFPIDQVVVVPGNPQTVNLDSSFWYDNPEDQPPEQLASKALDPLVDSFLITGDGNVVHVKFEVEYEINRDEVNKYLKNVGSIEKANQVVQNAAERGMIHSIATRNIEDLINKSEFKTDDIKNRTQSLLTDLDTGIRIRNILIANDQQSMPTQIRQAYEQVTLAQADKVRSIQQARQTFEATLGEAAGNAHPQVLQMIRAYEAALGNEQDALAQAMRGELNRSIETLLLPPTEFMDRLAAYQDAATEAAGSSDPQVRAAFAKASADLKAGLDALPAERTTGKPITGEIAATISRSRASRSEIATRAKLDFERYASALETFKKAPLVLANDRLQATREAVMGGDILVQTIIGEIDNMRIDTNADPEVQNEIVQQELADREKRAEQEAQNQ